ncbi:Swt1 family HEPN domain-containing protein [Lysobacter humi (ex Lee et al. 2017)]
MSADDDLPAADPPPFAEGSARALAVIPGEALRTRTLIAEQMRQLALGPSASVREALKALQMPHIGDAMAQARALIADSPMRTLVRDMQAAQAQLRALTAFPVEQFRTPAPAEISRLMAELTRNPVADWWQSEQARSQRQLQEAMAAIRQPYLDLGREITSFNAALELQTIGLAVRQNLGFDTAFARTLREDLGDWRDPVDDAIDPRDVNARTVLYTERGVEPALTAFPATTFTDLLDRAGLVLPALPSGQGDAADSTDFEGSKSAYAWLLHFEHAVRRFIDERMTQIIGPGWIRQRVHADIIARWQARQRDAEAARMARSSLLDHADFMDYPQIIIRSDNWRDVFQPVFARKENVSESFHRLKPVRNATMHAGLITPQDLLLMCVEIHRLMRAMRP